MSTDPFARQKLLAEVGEAGQKLLQEAQVSVPAGPGERSAVDYLRRAGIGALHIDPQTSPRLFPHEAFFRYCASGEFAFGAWQALDVLRTLLSSPRRTL